MRKRTTKKTGNFTKSTTTISSTRGTTQSNSFRAPGGPTRRTVSLNHKTGKTRTTYTTHHGGGWSTTRSKTTGGGKFKSGSRKGSGNEEVLIMVALAAIAGLFWMAWKVIVGLTTGLWGAAKLSVKEPDVETCSGKDIFVYMCKVIGMFVLYVWIMALLFFYSYKLLTLESNTEPPVISTRIEDLNLDKPIPPIPMEQRGQDEPKGPIQSSE